jgi:predicted DNA-binding transcriptional regulator AlpA
MPPEVITPPPLNETAKLVGQIVAAVRDAWPVPSSGIALLIGRLEAARLCGVSPASWDRLVDAGKTPKPLKLGGRVVWRRSDLEAWIGYGCPDRATFDALSAEERR